MKLDTRHMRYLTAEDWRVLTAVEIGSKNHELVPTKLIVQLSGLSSGSGVHKSISTLAKASLISRLKNAKYDGYRLSYLGFDYLALHTHTKRDALRALGSCIGTGKESDIYTCTASSSVSSSKSAVENVLKIHRLGRTSFRTVKTNRDYLRHRHSASWMYMSRLAAQKEFAFMQALHDNEFKVPTPLAWNRHTIVMSHIDGVPLRSVNEVGDPAKLYADIMDTILRFGRYGVIHGDFNEFNIILKEEDLVKGEVAVERGEMLEHASEKSETEGHPTTGHLVVPWIIDFPQGISIDHENAKFYFDRDVQCIKTFFERRFRFTSSEPGPLFEEAKRAAVSHAKTGGSRLDVVVEASGFSKKMARELEGYLQESEAAVEQPEDMVSEDDSQEELTPN